VIPIRILRPDSAKICTGNRSAVGGKWKGKRRFVIPKLSVRDVVIVRKIDSAISDEPVQNDACEGGTAEQVRFPRMDAGKRGFSAGLRSFRRIRNERIRNFFKAGR